MPEPREYSLMEKGTAILASDLSTSMMEVARSHGIPYETLRSWVRTREELGFPKEDSIKVIKELWADKVGDLFEECFMILRLSNKQVIKELPKASAAQAAVISGIMFDKLDKLRVLGSGDDDGPIDYSGMSDEEKLALVTRVKDRLENAMAVEADFEVIDE